MAKPRPTESGTYNIRHNYWSLVFSVAVLQCLIWTPPTHSFTVVAPLRLLSNKAPEPSRLLLKQQFDNVRQNHQVLCAASSSTDGIGDLLEEIRSMRVKEIKTELTEMGVSTNDVFEKEDLAQRLLKARQNPPKKTTSSGASSSSSSQSSSSSSSTSSSGRTALEAPLYLVSLQTGTRIAAVDGANISVEAKDHPYPAIRIQVPKNGKKNSDGEDEFTLKLLLDTACSGLVLRPSIVEKYNLPSLSTPVTMTGAAGVAGNTGLTQLDQFRLESQTFGPLPAAVQDIGALPSDLDGIIGLSFLSQFEGVDLNFRKGTIVLYPRGQSIPSISSDLTVVAEANMSLLPSLGIYAVDVLLGGRGPVKMLVDSGASDSFLNWKGVSDLGLSRDSQAVNRLPSKMGAVGSDSVAMELTHQIGISSTLNLGTGANKSGLPLKESRRMTIDIGDIAILDTLKNDKVGGILGIDAFMRCDAVRLTFQQGKRIQMLLNSAEAPQ